MMGSEGDLWTISRFYFRCCCYTIQILFGFMYSTSYHLNGVSASVVQDFSLSECSHCGVYKLLWINEVEAITILHWRSH